MSDIIERFKPLFHPETMAVIGASNNPVGAVKYVKGHASTGIKIFPVNTNPEITALEGFPVVRSISDIKENVDLAIIGVPKQHVPGVIASFNENPPKFAVIFTSGFEESGNGSLGQQLRESIARIPTRFIGPNCLGVWHPKGNLVYFPTLPMGEAAAGNVAFISQSGGHTAKTNSFLLSRGIKFSKTISIGNAVDLQPHDFLDYFKEDSDSAVVGMYLESTGNGRELARALREISPVKPVVIWKGGQGTVGFQATASHTGKLAGDYTLWKAMCKQTGTILAKDFDTFADLLTMFSTTPALPCSLNVAIVACGGGNAVEAADTFESLGFHLPELSKETKDTIGEFIPDVNSSFRNPVDLGEYGYVPKYFARAVEAVAADESIDALVYIKESSRFPMFSVNFLMSTQQYERETIKTLVKLHEKVKATRNIPLFLNDPLISESMEGFECRVSFRDKLIEKGIPLFARIDVIAEVIKQMHAYGQHAGRNRAPA